MDDQNKNKDFSVCTYGEAKTGGGQHLEFICRPDDIEYVKHFLADNIKSVDIPTTRRVSISHGVYGRYSRYNVVQHKYAGGGYGPGCGGFIEVLEIKNPPEKRHGIVLYEYINNLSSFTEWKTLENAKAAFVERNNSEEGERLAKLKGFIRSVNCGPFQPWFYAIGDEELIGDFVFPEGFQDDPVYRFGKKFVVTYEGYAEVKTCMGVRFIQKEVEDHYPSSKKLMIFRLIYWDDGSVTRDDCHQYRLENPRPLEEGEMWITEALLNFRRMLSGKTERFEINFTDGNKFVGRISKSGNKAKCPQGKYHLKVYFKGKKRPLEGWVDFKPTLKHPNVINYTKQSLKVQDDEIDRIQILGKKVERGGKKWSGVFFNLPE